MSQITNNMENPVVIWDTIDISENKIVENSKPWRIITGSLINYTKNNIDSALPALFWYIKIIYL